MTDTPWLAVSEIFGPTLQGEGAMVGARTHFVRLGGCDYRCSWCDTPYAVLPHHRPSWEKLDIDTIVARVETCGKASEVPWVTLSGGNPALFNHSATLCARLQEAGYRVAIETQGSAAPSWLAHFNHVCISPKPPSSMMDVDPNALLEAFQLAQTAETFAVKIVVFDDIDLLWAEQTFQMLRAHQMGRELPFYLSAGTPQQLHDDETKASIIERTKWLASVVSSRPGLTDVRILPQLHVLLWGTIRGK